MNINNFDLLRFLLAFTVALGHLIQLTPDTTFDSLAPYIHTHTAIACFYVISGFLVTKSFENTSSLKKFYVKRVRRIFPAYYFVIIFFAIILVSVSTLGFLAYFTNKDWWRYVIFNLLFQNYLQPTLPGVFEDNPVHAVNGALWTIKIEEGFYLVLPLVIYFYRKLPYKDFFLMVVYVLSLVFFNYFNLLDQYKIAKQLPGVFCYFISGLFLYYHFRWFFKHKYWLFGLALIVFILEPLYSPWMILYPFALALLVLSFAYLYPFAKNFGKYGDFTYGVYIFHFPLIQLSVALSFYEIFPPMMVFLGSLITIFLVGVASWYGIERRFVQRSFMNLKGN